MERNFITPFVDSLSQIVDMDIIKQSGIKIGIDPMGGAGINISSAITRAPGNDASMGGIKIILEDGSWCAVRPSGTEPIMKFYIESFGGEELVEKIHNEAKDIIFNH